MRLYKENGEGGFDAVNLKDLVDDLHNFRHYFDYVAGFAVEEETEASEYAAATLYWIKKLEECR